MGVVDLFVFYGRLFHEALTDGDGAIFKIIGLGKDSLVPRRWLLDAVVHGEDVLKIFCIVEDSGGRASEQEEMGDLVNCGDDVVVCQ